MKSLRKSSLREIRKSLGRYMAIVAIVTLGVGFFTGLRICKSAMVQTVDHYLGAHNFFDYRLISTLGFTAEDVTDFSVLDGVTDAEGTVFCDAMCVNSDGGNSVLKAHSLTESVNLLDLKAGRMPISPSEVIADSNAFGESAIGQKIILSPDNSEDTLSLFGYDEYTIVGIASSPYYMNYERGTTALGTGSVAGFVYIPIDGFDCDYFMEIYLKLETSGEIYSDEYNDCIAAFENVLIDKCDQRADLRYRKLVDTAKQDLNDAQAELDEEYASYLAERSDAEQELADARQKLDDAAIEISDNEQKLTDGEAALESGRTQYNSGLAAYKSSKADYESKKSAAEVEFAAAQSEIDTNRALVTEGMTQIENSGVLAQHAQLSSAVTALNAGLADVETMRGEALTEANSASAALATQEGECAAALSACESAHAANIEALGTEKNALNTQLTDAQTALDALDSESTDYDEQAAALNATITQLTGDISAVDARIDAENTAYATQKGTLEQTQSTLATSRTALDAQIAAINAPFDAKRGELTGQLATAQAGLDQINATGVVAQYDELKQSLAQLDAGQAQLDTKKADVQSQLSTYADQLSTAKTKLDASKREIDSAAADIESGKTQLADAKITYETGLADYESAKSEADAKFLDAENEFADAQQQIDEAAEEIDDINQATLYTLNRKTNVGYACFESDSQIVQGISTVFPLFFFLVAALVCMTTMTRMVDEQRTQIGVLKAMGYSRAAIMNKYLFYSVSAATIGSIVGALGGMYIFPRVIWMAYNIMYGFCAIEYVFSVPLALISFAAALLCSAGATVLSCSIELSEAPAQLLRPRAPKAGKRIFLEYIPFLWKRLKFLQKVSIRNIVRYKKRLLMMMIGIGGCTALLVTGFGIRDSISKLVDYQFDEIMLYDYSVSFTDPQGEADQAAFREACAGEIADCLFVYEGAADLAIDDMTKSIYLVATDSGSLEGYIDLHNGDEALTYPAPGEAVVNRGLAERYGLAVGDTLTLLDGDMNGMHLRITGLCDNYVNNYVFADIASVTGQWGYDPGFKTAFVNGQEGADHREAAARMAEYDGVSNVSISADLRERVGNMMSSMNYIVLLIIVCAGALAFIVLFNLTNINITERLREIATIKVLGFTLRETASYVLSENLVLSAMGALVGLPLGKVLHAFVMSQIKIDMVFFDVRIAPVSYAIAVVMTFLFAWLVNLAMMRRITRINMAESLKTVE